MMLLEQVASLIVGTKKLLFLEFAFNSLLGGDFLLTQHRETPLVEIQKYSVKVFSAIHVRNTTWIDCLTGGSNPFCIFNKNRVSLYARAGILSSQSFSLSSFYFSFFEKQTKNSLQFLFYSIEVLPPLLQIRVI